MALRMRTIEQAYNDIKTLDKETSLTLYSIRRLVKSGDIPSYRSGKKYIINLDILLDFLENPQQSN
jgi:excisionase family DNA binding protein